MALTDLIVPIAAGWGAILSTVMFILKLREDKIDIKIDYKNYLDDDEPDFIRDIYQIKAINNGNKPVTMEYAYIEAYPPRKYGILPTDATTSWDRSIDGRQIFFGQSVTVDFEFPRDFKTINQSRKNGNDNKVIAVFADQAGKIWKSRKPFKVG